MQRLYPFSSETKWSGGNFENGRTYIMGAAEFVFSDKEKYTEVYQAIVMVILFNVLYSIADKEIEKRKLQPHKATA